MGANKQLALEIAESRKNGRGPRRPLKRYAVVYPAVGLIDDFDDLAEAEKCRDDYIAWGNPSNSYGGSVTVEEVR